MPKTLPNGWPGGANGNDWIVMQVQERDGAEPRDRNQDGDEQRDGKPAGYLDAARVKVREQQSTRHAPGHFALPVIHGKVDPEIVHQQHAVETVEQKRAGPVPPAALKSPEISERGARPAIEAALRREEGC